MGRGNLGACAKQPDVVVTAACDVWEARRDAVVQQFKDTCKGYRDFREMLQQQDLDAVIIATPPHWHALIAIAACEAGKDIYLQKPMTLHLAESLAVRNAVKKHNRICQIGTQIHASENYRRVVEFIRSGNLGPVGVVRTFNVMNQMPDGVGHSPPTDRPGRAWIGTSGAARPRCGRSIRILATDAYNHCSWMDYSGGWTPGMAPHIIDLPVWALDLGFPLRTSSAGGRYFLKDDGDAYDNHEVLWQYPNLHDDLDVVADQQLRLRLAGRARAAAPAGHLLPRRQRHHVRRLRHVQDRARRRQDEGPASAAEIDPPVAGPRARMARLHQVAPAAQLQRVLPRRAWTCRSC